MTKNSNLLSQKKIKTLLRLLEEHDRWNHASLNQDIFEKRILESVFSIDYSLSDLDEYPLTRMRDRFDEDKLRIANDFYAVILNNGETTQKATRKGKAD